MEDFLDDEADKQNEDELDADMQPDNEEDNELYQEQQEGEELLQENGDDGDADKAPEAGEASLVEDAPDSVDEDFLENGDEETEEAEGEDDEEIEINSLDAEIAAVLDSGCEVVQNDLSSRLIAQSSRVTTCEQRLELVAQQHRQTVAGFTERLEKSEQERAEEQSWLAGLWPDDTPLPTLLVPLKKTSASVAKDSTMLVKDVADDQERQQLQALATRRVERERVRHKLQQASCWEVILSEEDPVSGNGEPQLAFYRNKETGESVWGPPVAMLFEPPRGWDLATMDWSEDYEVANFYPDATKRAAIRSNNVSDNKETHEDDSDDDEDASGLSKAGYNMEEDFVGSDGDDDNDDDDDDDDDGDDAPTVDPVGARDRLEKEIARYEQLKSELAESSAKQRSLAMELLTATRESFEHEQKVIEDEDAAVIAVERKRRVAEREEKAAMRAKLEAEQRKAQQLALESAGKAGGPSVQPTFARDGMAKKDLMLAADEELFERELREFAREQRADRLYLTTPATRDTRLRERHQLDPEFVHVKHVEERVLQAEKLEFDLLEKCALRHEEAASKADELHALCDKIRVQQSEVAEEILVAEAKIAHLEAQAAPAPLQPRPSGEELERAAERYLTVPPLPGDEEAVVDEANEGSDEATVSGDAVGLSEMSEKAELESTPVSRSEASPSGPSSQVPASVETTSKASLSPSPAADAALPASDKADVVAGDDLPCDEDMETSVKADEAELRELKSFVDAEYAWRLWEKTEAARCAELEVVGDRHLLLVASQKQLVVDLALYEDGDAPFFERLRDLEKAAHSRLWDLQAQSQVERARFVVERAAREESVYQMRDRVKELNEQLEDARRMPMRALHPLERVELEVESAKRTKELEIQAQELQTRYTKEEAAKELLTKHELRACDYADAKLQEEVKLFAEKQALWDLNFRLADELQTCRQTIERLYVLMCQQERTDAAGRKTKDAKKKKSGDQEDSTDTKARNEAEGDDDNHDSDEADSDEEDSDDEAKKVAAPTPRELYEENARVFETKLQYVQQVRQFLFTCYDREDRWRALAATALVKDSSSDEWMTAMQHSRHEDMLAVLQTQHEEQQLVLQRQIKMLTKVKGVLHAQIEDLDLKLGRVQREYQAASEDVRVQTREVIETLRAEVEIHKAHLAEEVCRFRKDRERLLQEHQVVREELEERLLRLEDVIDKQSHWLTAARRELHAQRVANEELLKAYQSLEKRRASETNDMRFRISAQIKKISNIEMWNLSLKLSAKEAHTEHIKMQQEVRSQERQHKQLQRRLRLQNWRHRVTAQAILTDVDLLFAFFADGLDILAGSTRKANDALRENAGIEVLAVLARHSNQPRIRAISARALGQVSWNANATARSIGWKAKRTWFQWMKARSDVVLSGLSECGTAFDAVADEQVAEANWLADTSAPADDVSGECDHDESAIGGKGKAKKLRFTETWQQFDDKVFPDSNVDNQQYMGLANGVLQTVLDLCRGIPERQDSLVQRNALLSLSLIVRSSRNTAIIGRMDGSVALLVTLLAPKPAPDEPEDPQVVRHAIQALGNLAFRNAFNQQAIYDQGAVHMLLHYCDRALHSGDVLNADVDLTLASVQALSHLSHEHTPSCQAIVDARGVSVLTRLCDSPRIRDAIELEVFELIQTFSAQILANVITLLDEDDNESSHRGLNVANSILEGVAQSQNPGLSSALALADHDNQNSHQHDTATRAAAKHAGVCTFVLMCASCNREVAFHGAVVLGSIARHDALRAAIGAASGMDALFLLTGNRGDLQMVAQATWALANLTWNRENQYRVARYLDQLYELCTMRSMHPHSTSTNQQEIEEDSHETVGAKDPELVQRIREYSLCVLANSLFYNEANRQLVASHTHWLELLAANCLEGDSATLEHSARALCSLSYSDSIALQLGSTLLGGRRLANRAAVGPTPPSTTTMSGLQVFVRLCGRAGQVDVQKHGLFGVINMCLHDANKSRLLEIPHGVDTLVNLSGQANSELSEPAHEALELLADLRQLQQDHGVSSLQSFVSVDMKKLIALLADASSPALVVMLSDAIADEVWRKPSAQVRLRNEHGLERLLELCVAYPTPFSSALATTSPAMAADMERRVLVSCLWALRNTLAGNVRNQDLVGALGGVTQLVRVFDRNRQSEEVVEALLATLVALVMKHPRNSQQLVQVGLDMLIGLADGATTDSTERLEAERGASSNGNKQRGITLPPLTPTARPASPAKPTATPNSSLVDGNKQLENAALARELLHLVAPYNSREDAQVWTADSKTGKISSLSFRRDQRPPQELQPGRGRHSGQ